MFSRIKHFSGRLAAGTTALVASGAALATEPPAGIDVTEAVGVIDGGMTAVTALGGAALVIVAATVIYKLVRRAA